jgi:hypothetical protein
LLEYDFGTICDLRIGVREIRRNSHSVIIRAEKRFSKLAIVPKSYSNSYSYSVPFSDE